MIRRFVALSSTTSTLQPRMLRSGVAGGASGSVVAWTGRTRRNVLPSPGMPLLVAVSVPPIDSASRRLIASPRPVPP